MYRIGASVGKDGSTTMMTSSSCRTLLNKSSHIIESIGKVPEDGNLDEGTQRAIIAFQHDIVRIASPDGRVDPNGRTFRS